MSHSRPASGRASEARLRAELEQLRDLPSPPAVLQEIWRALESDSSSAETLSDTIRKDPALSAKLLRLANSAYYAPARTIADVKSACVVLGFGTVRALAIGVSALDRLTGAAGEALDLNAFWRHSVGAGTAAQAIARKLRLGGQGPAFCGGILHDVGQLVLATLSADRYARVAVPDAAPVLDRERAEYGAGHDLAGAWLADTWRFPAEISEAIRYHHAPWTADGVTVWGAMTHVADWIASTGGCPPAPADSAVADAPDPRALEMIALGSGTLDELVTAFAGQLEKVEAFVDLARG